MYDFITKSKVRDPSSLGSFRNHLKHTILVLPSPLSDT